ncbi:DUF4834 domain-containing protein [Sungkyunkwania multivorans]|uniref:DUF4834 domain-containing protein n=1 Tax=Sungkyunkwania multivorans TaxID=1173618 RepID=A0ABW3CX00_9FLAO
MTQTASLIGVLNVILIILVVSYLLRLLSPYILRYLFRRVEKKFTSQFQQYQHHTSSKEGEVTVDKRTASSKKSNPSVGEYIEFEEID